MAPSLNLSPEHREDAPVSHQPICSVLAPISLPLFCFFIKGLLEELNIQAQCAAENGKLSFPLSDGAARLRQEAEGKDPLSEFRASSGVNTKMSSVQTFTITALFDSNGPLSAPSLLSHPIQLIHHPPCSKRELSKIQIRSHLCPAWNPSADPHEGES